MRIIYGDALIKRFEDRKNLFCKNRVEYSMLNDKDKARVDELTNCIADVLNASTIEPERKVEELLPDGTLHLFTNTDLSKVNRVLVSQNGTHYGDLYYADGEPKIGKWIPHNTHYTFVTGETSDGGVKCSSCGFETHNKAHIMFGCPYKFCPDCGSYNGGESE